MLAMNWPRKGWGLPLWETEGSLLRVHSLVTFWGNIFQYLLRGIMLTCTLGLIFMIMFLVLFFVVSNNLVWKVTCLSDVYLVRSEPALGLLDIFMLLVRDSAGTILILS